MLKGRDGGPCPFSCADLGPFGPAFRGHCAVQGFDLADAMALAAADLGRRGRSASWGGGDFGDIAGKLRGVARLCRHGRKLARSQPKSCLASDLAKPEDPAELSFVAIGALIAFTPGQRWERFTRGALVGVIGGVVGALMTVAVVALGFGGEAHRAVLIGDPSQVRVLDGDTLMINETSIRLWGVDAPELGQSCLGRQPNCGESSRNALVNLVRDRMVRCHAQRSERGRRVESFGRPLMQCFVGQGDNETDLAERMILDGHAVAFRSTRNRAVSEAYEALENFQDGCTLRPEVWRRNDTARREWEAGNNPNVAPDDRIGCGDSPAP